MAQPQTPLALPGDGDLCRVAQPPPGARAIPVGAAPGAGRTYRSQRSTSRLPPDAITLRGEHDQRPTRVLTARVGSFGNPSATTADDRRCHRPDHDAGYPPIHRQCRFRSMVIAQSNHRAQLVARSMQWRLNRCAPASRSRKSYSCIPCAIGSNRSFLSHSADRLFSLFVRRMTRSPSKTRLSSQVCCRRSEP